MARRYTLTPQDVQAVNNTAARLGVRPADLIAVMHYETIGTMNPTIKGGKGGRYQGLIQFGPSERRTYGYDADASFAEQVEGPVYRYLKDRGLPQGADLGTIYRTVNGGNPLAKLWKNDGNGTIAQHIERIRALSLPLAGDILQGVGPDVSAIMDVAGRYASEPAGADAPTALQGFAPSMPDAGFAPAQAAIADMLAQPGDLTADQVDELTRTDVAGNYLNQPQSQPMQLPPQWDAATGFPEQPRRPGPGGALGVDLGMQPAGMPVPPSRPGSFDWLGGGAPDAGLVPPPGISPLRPAMGGPGDRRPQPPTPAPRPWQGPMPQGRPGNFHWTGGGAPGAPPDPRMRPSGPQSPVDAFSPSAGPLDLIPYSTQPRATPAPPIPGLDRSILAGGNLGTPETAMSLERTFPPPSPLAGIDQRMDRAFSDAQSRGLARELGFNRRQMEGFTPPPRSFDIATGPSPPEHRSGEWFTPAPPMPTPLAEARMKDDVFSPSSAPAAMAGIEDVFGPTPAPAAVSNLAIPYDQVPGQLTLPQQLGIDNIATAAMPSPASWANGMDMYVPNRFSPAALGITQPTAATGEDLKIPGSEPGVGGVLPEEEPPQYIPPYAQRDPSVAAPAPAPRQQAPWTHTGRQDLSPFARAVTSVFAPFAGGRGGGGFIGPNGFFSNAGSFTPFGGPGAGGSSPFNMQPNGQMGSTNWRHGSVTGNPNMQGTMWNRSGDNGSVGYVTDPFTGSMIYSGSPNRL